MRKLLIKLLLKLLKIPLIEGGINKDREQEMFWGLYPTQEFRNYIARRDLQILQLLGEGVSRDDYLTYLGHRFELQQLLRYAKQSFEIVEQKKKK